MVERALALNRESSIRKTQSKRIRCCWSISGMPTQKSFVHAMFSPIGLVQEVGHGVSVVLESECGARPAQKSVAFSIRMRLLLEEEV